MSHPSHNIAQRFDPATDPTVAKLTRQINRSAGQHKRALSEGTASAQAILRRVPMTTDPLRLDDGIPVLRMVHSRHERAVAEPVPFKPVFMTDDELNALGEGHRTQRPADEPSPLEQGGALYQGNPLTSGDRWFLLFTVAMFMLAIVSAVALIN